LKATHIKTLEYISLEELIKFEYAPLSSMDWTELNNILEKTFKFDNYSDVVLFTNQVMQIAIEHDHHPEIQVHYNFVKVRITDYEKGAVSEKCHRFIKEVNKIK
jgi:4a-hydroxytetrahydrobiopterin dehydratase